MVNDGLIKMALTYGIKMLIKMVNKDAQCYSMVNTDGFIHDSMSFIMVYGFLMVNDSAWLSHDESCYSHDPFH